MTDNPTLQEREENVLSSVIHTFVATAKPVGSQAIAEGMDLSPATIRHVLMDLETKGFLTHPHTSAGRIPVDQGYRFYVDRLMRARELKMREKKLIEQEYEKAKEEIETLMGHTARILSAMTRLAGLAFFHVPREVSLDHFKLVTIDSRRVLVILVLDQGLVKEEMVLLGDPVDLKEIVKITRLLNTRFGGSTLSEIRESLLKEAEKVKKARLGILETALRLINGALEFEGDEIHMEGAFYLTEQPEFKNYQMMEQLMKLVEEKQHLARVLSRGWGRPGLTVDIGGDLPEAFMRNFSFVHVPYYYRGRAAGALGILGPTRMEYDRAAGVVRHMAGHLEAALSRLGG